MINRVKYETDRFRLSILISYFKNNAFINILRLLSHLNWLLVWPIISSRTFLTSSPCFAQISPPDENDHIYNLRSRSHSLSLTAKTDCNNFLNRLLFKDIY